MQRITHVFPVLLALAAACQEQSAVPTGTRPLFAAAAPAACPTPATVTVSDEAGLRAAIAAATPGTVIGIRGMIGLTQDDSIETAGITLTCATPGSGLFAVPGGSATDLLTVDARKVGVDHLVLDASQAIDGPYLSENDGVTVFAESTRFTNNTVTCPPNGVCAFIAGGIGAVVSDNTFQANGPFTGIQLQTNGAVGEIRIDGAHVERNTLVTTAPSTGLRQGAIRPFDVVQLVIADNTAVGPWRTGVSATRVSDSRISGNTLQGAAEYGIQTNARVQLPDDGRVRNTVFSSNRISGAGIAGVFPSLACGNAFVGNNLQGNVGGVGLLFDVTSGANTYAGDRTVVVDNGAFDCNGDGVNDPNIISGPGMARHGLGLGLGAGAGGLGESARSVHGIALK
jgi:nitrous oxidase accessory protein NosD